MGSGRIGRGKIKERENASDSKERGKIKERENASDSKERQEAQRRKMLTSQEPHLPVATSLPPTGQGFMQLTTQFLLLLQPPK